MINVTIQHAAQRSAVEEILEQRLALDPNFNGAKFEIEIGDWLSVEDDGLDAYALSQLYYELQEACEAEVRGAGCGSR